MAKEVSSMVNGLALRTQRGNATRSTATEATTVLTTMATARIHQFTSASARP